MQGITLGFMFLSGFWRENWGFSKEGAGFLLGILRIGSLLRLQMLLIRSMPFSM